MTPDHVFTSANALALSAWVLLAALPGRRWVSDLVAGALIPALLSVLYVAIAVSQWGGSGGFSSLSAVATLFSNSWVLVAGWLHYLAFDLLVGSWEVRDARRRGIPHVLVVPSLGLTFLFGPAGWLCYLALRAGHERAAARRSPFTSSSDGRRRSLASPLATAATSVARDTRQVFPRSKRYNGTAPARPE